MESLKRVRNELVKALIHDKKDVTVKCEDLNTVVTVLDNFLENRNVEPQSRDFWDWDAQDCYVPGLKIDTIRNLRRKYGWSLADAKRFVERPNWFGTPR